jgi:methyl-accepting chemotaxis protein
VIEFNMDGSIVTANQNFLNALGYRLDEIQGKQHSMFVPVAQRDSADYRAFWAALNRGEFQAGEYKRIAKGGREIWIEASYNPVLDGSGKPLKVVKFATDVTRRKLRGMADASKIAASDRAQAVIEFNLDGTVRTANGNFLKALGYSLDEIKGKQQASQHFHAAGRARQRGLSRVLGEAEPRRISGRRVQAHRQGRQGGLDPRVVQSDAGRDRQAVRRR